MRFGIDVGSGTLTIEKSRWLLVATWSVGVKVNTLTSISTSILRKLTEIQ